MNHFAFTCSTLAINVVNDKDSQKLLWDDLLPDATLEKLSFSKSTMPKTFVYKI